MNFETTDYIARLNADLDGYVITFKETGNTAHTQYNVVEDPLRADCGERYLERYNDYDDDLTGDENDFVEKFVLKNKWER